VLFSFKRCEHGGRDLASAGAEIQAVRLTSGVAWLAEPPAADFRFCERGKDLRRGDVEPSGVGEGTAKWRRRGVSLSSATPRAAKRGRHRFVLVTRARRAAALPRVEDVGAHRLLGGIGVAGLDGVEDPLVLVERHVELAVQIEPRALASL
jgi:hypothetical protein